VLLAPIRLKTTGAFTAGGDDLSRVGFH